MDLKLGTAGQEILLGPFLDDDDGITQKTGLTIANTDIKLFKTGGTTLGNKNSGGATEIATGFYYATLDATDTDTLGPLVIVVQMTDCLCVRHEFNVVSAAYFDWVYGTTKPDVNTYSITNDAITAASINTGAFTADAFAADAIVAATLATDCITDDAIATGAIASTAFAAGAITNAACADDIDVNVKTVTAGAITADAIAAGAIDNATFAADIGSTAYATNIIALAVRKALDEIKLDHLVAIADADDVVNDSIIGKLASTDGDWSNFSDTTDSLQSIRDKLPANLEDLSIVDTTGLVDITQTAADKVWGTAARVLTANTNLANLEVDLTKIHGSALTETAGQLAAAFIKFFDVGTPVLTCESVNQAQDNATTAEIKTAIEAGGSSLAQILAAVITNAAGADVAADIIALKAVADLIEDIERNRLEVTNADGAVVLRADNNTDALYTVAACVTDNSTTTIRKRLE